ncbi:hypothetical protein [Shouchella lehensis]|uniref:SnoaL-like domain-containing protein n=1 Tax=Shouchella lehensis G1 TaxID=1246626 RepID=A0A060M581_9BACI|nr:hypothetical protein [Shouchella lehensis]AIC95718.1 hypothetical protein BleG1_3154 [Shouchella lehensis G1]
MYFETTFTPKQVAEFFSTGNFNHTYQFLDKNVEWNIVGDKVLVGKKAVMDECRLTSNYFESVTTNFKLLNVIQEENYVVINGTAEFIRDNKLLSYIAASDIYSFDDQNMLQKIDSYCIKIQ